MKRLHTFILKKYITPLIITFIIAVFVLLMQFIWKYVDDMVGKGLEFSVIVELLFYASSYIVPMALPLAILVASIMTFGNLGENSELLALKSSGISLQSVMAPLIICTALISGGAFLFSNHVLPATNLRMQALLWDIRNKRPELDLKAGSFNNDIRGYTIKIGEKDHKTQTMYDVIIYNHTGNRGNTNITTADSATMQVTTDNKYLILHLYNGTIYEELRKQSGRSNNAFNRLNFSKQKNILSLESLEFNRSSLNLFRHGHMTQNLKQLQSNIDTLKMEIDKRRKHISHNIIKQKVLRKSLSIPLPGDSVDVINPYDTLSTEVVMNTDSIFEQMNEKEKETVLKFAHGFADLTEEYVIRIKDEKYRSTEPYNKHRIEWHNKFTLAFSCLIFFFVGAPLGAIVRKGGFAWPLVIAAFLFVAYYVVSLTGKKLSAENILPVFSGMWLAPFLLFTFGIYLTGKAINDSVMLKIETYRDIFKNIFSAK